MKICSVDGCNGKHEAKGYCKKHYKAYRKYGDPLATPIKKQTSKRVSKPYEDNHKYIDNVEHKLCSDCDAWLPLTEEYYYKNDKSKIDGFNPYCKKCTKKRSNKWRNEHREEALEKMRINTKKYRKEHKKEIKEKDILRKGQLKINLYNWQKLNKSKLKEYAKNRMRKKHDITDYEWFYCLDYFNHSCAYCGLKEDEQFQLYNQNFHKEHVDHNGSNYIDNCVPSCTKCNSSKHESTLNDWYNENNEVFLKRRYNKIVNWIIKECFKVLNLN